MMFGAWRLFLVTTTPGSHAARKGMLRCRSELRRAAQRGKFHAELVIKPPPRETSRNVAQQVILDLIEDPSDVSG